MIEVAADADALAIRAAARLADAMGRAIEARGRAVVFLSGGGTPRATYARLARDGGGLDWSRVHLAFGDERCVPPDDPRSNFRMVRDTLLAHVPIPATQVHRIAGEDPPAYAAADYERRLRALLRDDRPDLVLLGLGEDGHTASLFPGQRAIHEPEHWAVAEEIAELAAWRVTITPPLINRAREIVFLVSGAAKADALRATLDPAGSAAQLPARAIRPDSGRVDWLVDEAARGE